MASTGTPMLFCPPLPPLRLRPHVTVVLGRNRSCDLQIGGTDASRRHAEIVTLGDGFAVRDLGSTNGTFVNGERVAEQRLRPGDRIEIGGSTITFCQVAASPRRSGAERSDEQTVLVERPLVGEVFQGDLAEIPAFAVLQILEMGRKTGVLEVDDARGGPGRLWLAAGAPIHAEAGRQSGFDAAISIVQAATGRFAFRAGVSLPKSTIEATATELLLEATRLADEAAA